MKRLTKSNNKKICGVCAGVAEFFGIDPTIVRLLAVILVFCGIGTGIVVYIVAAFVLPEPDLSDDSVENLKSANITDGEPHTKNAEYSDKGHSDEAFNSYFDDDK